MDILNYAAIKRYHDALFCNLNLKTGAGTAAGVSSAMLLANNPFGSIAPPTGAAVAEAALFTCWASLCSCLLVCRVPSASGFRVCDPNGTFRCGVCCLWTVPAGVTFAQFQLWGPGSSTGTICCCGGSIHGPTGAYLVANIPVTPGAQYTICSGCAQCCCTSGGSSSAVCGTPSWVTGPNLTGVCADSGISCMTFYNFAMSRGTSCNSCCVWWNEGINGYVGNMCSCTGSWEFCTTGPSSAWVSNYGFACCTRARGSVSGTGSYIFGIPGMYPKVNLNTSFNGTTTMAPVFGYTTTSMCVGCYTGSTCIGCCFNASATGCLQIPGAGGFYSAIYGGCSPSSSDQHGRMGMVCVTFC